MDWKCVCLFAYDIITKRSYEVLSFIRFDNGIGCFWFNFHWDRGNGVQLQCHSSASSSVCNTMLVSNSFYSKNSQYAYICHIICRILVIFVTIFDVFVFRIVIVVGFVVVIVKLIPKCLWIIVELCSKDLFCIFSHICHSIWFDLIWMLLNQCGSLCAEFASIHIGHSIIIFGCALFVVFNYFLSDPIGSKSI